MPSDPQKNLIHLAKKSSLTDQELAQFKSNFENMADINFRQRLAEDSERRAAGQKLLEGTAEHDVITRVVDDPHGGRKTGYNLLEVALKAKNNRVVDYLIDKFERSYTNPDPLLKVKSKTPSKLPIELLLKSSKALKNDRALLEYVTNKDTEFEFKHVQNRLREQRNTSDLTMPEIKLASSSTQEVTQNIAGQTKLPSPPPLLTSRNSTQKNVLDAATVIVRDLALSHDESAVPPPPPPRVKGDKGVGGLGNSI